MPWLNGKVSSDGTLNAWKAFSNIQPVSVSTAGDDEELVFDERLRSEILETMKDAHEESFSNQIFVKFKEDTNKEIIVDNISPSAKIVNVFTSLDVLVLEFDSVQEAKDMVYLYNNSDSVCYAEPNYIYNILD